MRHLSDRKKTDFQPHVQPHLPLLHCDACVVPMSWSHDSYPGQDQESMTRSECHVARQRSQVVAEQTLIQARLPHRPHTEVYVRRRAIPCRDGVEAGYILEGRSPLWDVCASLRGISAKARRAVPSCPPSRSQLRQGHPDCSRRAPMIVLKLRGFPESRSRGDMIIPSIPRRFRYGELNALEFSQHYITIR